MLSYAGAASTIIDHQDSELGELSPFATLSCRSKGSLINRGESRSLSSRKSIFLKDREALLSTPLFSLLNYKSQGIFFPDINARLVRSRLNHTIEVQRLSRHIACKLHLNEALTDAIAIGHDLGQPPFGYAGERALHQLSMSGFHHSPQAVRAVGQLERQYDFCLSFEVIDGILRHAHKDHELGGKVTGVRPQTLEGEVVRLVDSFVYLCADIDDAVQDKLLYKALEHFKPLDELGRMQSERIRRFIDDVVSNSAFAPYVSPSKEVLALLQACRYFFKDCLFKHPQIKKAEQRMKDLVSVAFMQIMENPEKIKLLDPYSQVTPEKLDFLDAEEYERTVIDFIVNTPESRIVDFYQDSLASLPSYFTLKNIKK